MDNVLALVTHRNFGGHEAHGHIATVAQKEAGVYSSLFHLSFNVVPCLRVWWPAGHAYDANGVITVIAHHEFRGEPRFTNSSEMPSHSSGVTVTVWGSILVVSVFMVCGFSYGLEGATWKPVDGELHAQKQIED